MIFLYICVIACQLFSELPINSTFAYSAQDFFGKDEYANISEVHFINPLDVWFQNVCNYCFSEWEVSYVENASLYTKFLLFTRSKLVDEVNEAEASNCLMPDRKNCQTVSCEWPVRECRMSEENYTVVNISDPQLLYSGGFDPSKNTKVLIHGWMDNATIDFAEKLEFSYQLAENVNIIAVDWSGMSQTFYPLSRSAVTPVGRYTAKFVDFLVSKLAVSPASIHLIGHSLGAHIAGVVGEYVTFGNLSRITGLDPAAPLFGPDSRGRLDQTDAQFVDVIHTAGGYVGYYQPCGHIDFYPNGGVPIQPGCGVDIGFCSHRRSYLYFSESISSLGFISTMCDNWDDYKNNLCVNNTKDVLGEHVNQRAQGIYYLHTNPTSPFAAWNNSVTAE